MSRVPFKKALACNLDGFYNNMSAHAKLRSDVHEVLMEIQYADIEPNQMETIKYFMEQFANLYHLCDLHREEFKNFIQFLDPKEAQLS